MNTAKLGQTLVLPDWPAPENVRAVITTRAVPEQLNAAPKTSFVDDVDRFSNTKSCSPYNEFNLAVHVEDNPVAVENNRAVLKRLLNSDIFEKTNKKMSTNEVDIQWLIQVHGKELIELTNVLRQLNNVYSVDGSYTSLDYIACAILTADCLPILICDKSGHQVAAVHAGWQGLAKGIITETMHRFSAKPEDLLVYLGPAISSQYYEVGESLKTTFEKVQAKSQVEYHESVERSFTFYREAEEETKYLADLYRIAQSEINGFGCFNVYGGNYCTASDKFKDKNEFMFYSYRREGVTGRMASLIWKS